MTLCRLHNRSILRIKGADRESFLQGLISNDVRLARPGKPIYAALLTPQGKFLHDLFLIDEGDEYLIDCEAERAGDLLKRLVAHKLRAKVTFENLAGELEVWAAWDEAQGTLFYPDPRLEALGMRAVLPKNSGKVSADFRAYDRHRLTLGVPDGSRDLILEKSTLLEGNFDRLNGISWSKGCYMGQELTARMHYRALVKRRLFPVHIEGPSLAFDAILEADGKEVGEMRSSDGDLGLALLNIDAVQMTLTCGETTLKASYPDWLSEKI